MTHQAGATIDGTYPLNAEVLTAYREWRAPVRQTIFSPGCVIFFIGS